MLLIPGLGGEACAGLAGTIALKPNSPTKVRSGAVREIMVRILRLKIGLEILTSHIQLMPIILYGIYIRRKFVMPFA